MSHAVTPFYGAPMRRRMLGAIALTGAIVAGPAVPAYAVPDVDSLGTGGSTGCPTSGARNEQAGAKAVVDWLNGRARGWAPDGTPVTATWSTGNVGMIGQSYDGTLPNMAAATGVKGLKAIVPIAGISSWYDYYRANGGVLAP